MAVIGDIFNIEERVRAEFSPLLLISFNPMIEKYQVFEQVQKYRPEIPFGDGMLFSSYTDLMHVHTLENEDGSFRPLDQRLMWDLFRMDTHRNERWLQDIQEQAQQVRETAKRDRDDHNMQVMKYRWKQVREQIAYGKG